MNFAIIIPSRFGSKRLPGKPLALIGGKTMLSHVVAAAKEAAREIHALEVFVATDDARIEAHCRELDIQAIMTSPTCRTGSDRVLEAIQQLHRKPDFVINLQGDAPFIPPHFLIELIEKAKKTPDCQIVTPIYRLSWKELDELRDKKKTTPFSGTTVTIDATGRALWFSKAILPQIRDESELRRESVLSPVYAHVGLYGYSVSFLEQYVTWPLGYYEKLEGLEQLRALEQGIPIHTFEVSFGSQFYNSGIDSPEDILRAEKYIEANQLS